MNLCDFWYYVSPPTGTRCRIWTRSLDRYGYGQLRNKERTLKAHRVAWEITNQQRIPVDKVVMHLCDNRACCEPTHLQLGCRVENIQDCVAKNRHAKQEGQGTAKLNLESVNIIREELAKGISQKKIAKRFGVSEATISRVKHRVHWRT